MKIVLISDVDGLGSRGELVEVKDGYANNYLIPKGLAVRSTKGKAREAAHLAEEKMAKADRELRKAEETSRAISEHSFEIAAKAGAEGKLFGAITSRDIAALLEKEMNLKVDHRKIHLEEHIKTMGFHEARIKLHPQVEAVVHLKIVPEKS